MNAGAEVLRMQVKSRKVPVVRATQLIVHIDQPISITGVGCITPGTACT